MRMFVAIKIPDFIKQKISSLKTEFNIIDGIKWVSSQNLHLTLKFIGEIKEELLEPVLQTINSCIKDIKPFPVSFNGTGAFPNPKYPKILWVGMKDGKEQVIKLMISLNKELTQLGIEFESREPSPHLTIGRVKHLGKKAPPAHSGMIGVSAHPGRTGVSPVQIIYPQFESESFLVDSIYLIKSELTPTGPIYSDLKQFNLNT